MYELARKGEEFTPKPRKVEIYDIKITKFELPYVELEVACSSGTYIRSLAYDIGKILKTGAYIKELERIEAGNFKLLNSICLDDDNIKNKIISPEDVFDFKIYELNNEEYKRVKNGNPIPTRILDFKEQEKLFLKYDKKIVSISTISDKIIKSDKIFTKNLKE